MKLFRIKKGIRCSVYFPGNVKQRLDNFATRKDLTFEREEMIFDPIALANGQLEKASEWCRKMAKNGFAGFRRNEYLLVVDYNRVEII